MRLRFLRFVETLSLLESENEDLEVTKDDTSANNSRECAR
jgi:hypothetical protein